MEVSAKSKNVQVSPFKLRPIAAVISGKSLATSLAYLKTHMTQRVKPILKVINSAYANAQNLSTEKIDPADLIIKKILIDQGSMMRYFKPSAMGRAAAQRRRLSQITVVLEKKA